MVFSVKPGPNRARLEILELVTAADIQAVLNEAAWSGAAPLEARQFVAAELNYVYTRTCQDNRGGWPLQIARSCALTARQHASGSANTVFTLDFDFDLISGHHICVTIPDLLLLPANPFQERW